MNVHYIKQGVLSETTLCVKELDEISANAENIHIKIVNMLDGFGIDINNVIFVSDRGSEIIAALKDYSRRLNCAAQLFFFFYFKLKKLNMFVDGAILIEELRREAAMVDVEREEEEEDYVPQPKRREVTAEDLIIDEFCNSNFGDQPLDDVQQYLNSFVIVPESGERLTCASIGLKTANYFLLYKLSLKYLCVPAFSATAESKFS